MVELFGCTRFHKCFEIASLFHSLLDINPKPSSSLSTYISSQATLALWLFKLTPDHKNTFKVESISLKILKGRKKRENQYSWMLKRMTFIKVSLPVQERDLPFHEVILPRILFINGLQSSLESLVEPMGTPRYLNEGFPSSKLRTLQMLAFSSLLTWERKTNNLSSSQIMLPQNMYK